MNQDLAATVKAPATLTGERACQRMALLAPSSWDEATRTATIVISTDADVGDGVRLLHNREAIRWPARPLPADIDHARSSASVWGAITALDLGPTETGATALIGTVQVDGPPEAMAVAIPRLRSGSARFSVDARVYGWDPAGPQQPFDLATDWEPVAVSLVVAGQDPAGVMRTADPSTHDADQQPSPDSPPMTLPNDQAGGDPATNPPEDQTVTTPAAAPAPSVPAAEPAGDEVARELHIRRAAGAASLPEATVQDLIQRTAGKDLPAVMVELARAARLEVEAKAPTAAGHPARVEVTRDAGDTLVRAFSDELERRCGLIKQPTETGRQVFGLSLLEMARSYLQSRGVNTQGMGKNQVVQRAFHSTSDFPLLFEAVASKTLLAAYAEEPSTWRPLARQRNLPDFKSVSDLQIAGQIVPEPLLEGGEYKAGTLTEGKATWKLATYGKKINVTRQAIINDDLDALSRVPEMMGRGCRLLESNLVWEMITTGANGATVSLDGQALFASGHNNTVTGSGSSITIAGMDAAKQKLRDQKDLAGNRINLTPFYLVVPSTLETTALQLLNSTAYGPTALTGNAGPNVFAGSVELIVEPRLNDDSTSVWYLTSSPTRVEMITFGYLADEPGPTITNTEKRDPDGVELLVRMDFGCTLSDYRGFVRAAGVA
jgi:hypothetical protein